MTTTSTANRTAAYWGGHFEGENEDTTRAAHAQVAAYWEEMGEGEAFARGLADGLAARLY